MSLMPDIEIKKEELLSVLKENLKKHISEVKELLLARQLEINEFFTDEIGKMHDSDQYQPKEMISFPLPKDNSKSYEKAIKMVEMSVNDTIVLNEHQFDQLVMDNWHWKQDLIATSALYKKF